MSAKHVTLTIDGQQVTVPDGTLVIRAAESIGTYIPRFCDHPYLEPLGACRQCMVEVEGQRKPLTSCTTTVTEGMVVKTHLTSEIARDAQEGVLELLLINHPLDCPMCDKGGECPLQDQTLAYGPGGSRFVDAKRRFVKPVPVNENIFLDRERCVLCARCTRFASEISGDPFIELFERGALEQVAIFEDEPYDSIFSGNVIQICPVGALTSREFRFKARPFDMTSTGSTCTKCASGCALTFQERRNAIVRVLADDDPAVNDQWNCDRGRFGWDFVRSEDRIVEPMVRKNGDLVAVSWGEATRIAAGHIREAREGGKPVGVVAGGNVLDEDAFALSLFARTVLGTSDVTARIGPETPEVMQVLGALRSAKTATNEDIDAAHLIVVAGCDLYHESPIVFLRVRKAESRGAKVIDGLDSVDAAAKALEVAGERAVILAGEDLGKTEGALTAAWELANRTGAAFGWVPRKAGAPAAIAAGLHAGRTTTEILNAVAGGGLLVLAGGADLVQDFSDSALAERAVGGATTIAIDILRSPTVALADVVLPACATPERDGTISNWERRPRQIRAAVVPPGLAVPDWEALSRIAAECEVDFPSSLGQLQQQMSRVAWIG